MYKFVNLNNMAVRTCWVIKKKRSYDICWQKKGTKRNKKNSNLNDESIRRAYILCTVGNKKYYHPTNKRCIKLNSVLSRSVILIDRFVKAKRNIV